MKNIISSFHRYKYLLILSISSALIVVVLQTIVNSVFSPHTSNLQNIYLEQATGEIVPITQKQIANQLVSTLQAHELTEFEANGQYEDKLASQEIRRIDIQLEKLLVVLDESTDPQVHILEENVIVSLGNTVDVEISLCTKADQNRQSCTIYLVDKSGHSIPINVRLLSTNNSKKSAINIRQGDITERYPGIFSGQPIELDIRVI